MKELAMGMPNSDDNTLFYDVLTDVLLGGEALSYESLHTMGIGRKFLARTLEMVKPHLPYVPGDRPLKDFEDKIKLQKEWKRCIDESGVGEQKCLLLSNNFTGSSYPVVGVHPKSSGIFVYVEIFLTRKGEWIVYRTQMLPEPDDAYFTIHDTVDSLCDRLEHELAGETHRVHPIPYTFTIAYCLIDFVRQCIAEREKRIDTQKSLIGEWEAMKDRLRPHDEASLSS